MGTKKAAAEILLHPQRLAIARALSGTQLTTKELAARLSDIPQATLYRHLGMLLDSGAITVVHERKVRGTPERTFALGDKAVLTKEEFDQATAEDHFRYFTTFVSGLLDEFGTYLAGDPKDLQEDGVGYRQIVLNLSDDEFTELLTELRSVITARAGKPMTEERRARLLSIITMPVTARKEPTND